MGKKFLKQYEIFFKKAIVDLNSAKVILASFEKGDIELDIEVIFFHLQQSAEKLLKTFLDFHQIKFPRTHDLQILVNPLEENEIKLDNSKELLPLSIYALEGRYAILHDDLEDVNKYIEILEDMINKVKERL